MKFALLGVATLALGGSLALVPVEVLALGPGSTCPNGLVLKGTPTGNSYHTTMTWSCVPRPSTGSTTKPVTTTGSHVLNPNGNIHAITVQNTPTPPKKCQGHTANALIGMKKC